MNNITGDLLNVRKIPSGDTYRLRGEIYRDSRGVFPDGSIITTSPVKEHDGSIYITLNSIYDVRYWAPGAAP